MRTSMRDDLTAAIKSRDRVVIAALRSALAAIENAEAQPADRHAPATAGSDHVAGAATGLGAAEVARRHLTDDDVRTIVQREVDDRSAAAADYERHGRADLAEGLRAEAAVLGRYLG